MPSAATATSSSSRRKSKASNRSRTDAIRMRMSQLVASDDEEERELLDGLSNRLDQGLSEQDEILDELESVLARLEKMQEGILGTGGTGSPEKEPGSDGSMKDFTALNNSTRSLLGTTTEEMTATEDEEDEHSDADLLKQIAKDKRENTDGGKLNSSLNSYFSKSKLLLTREGSKRSVCSDSTDASSTVFYSSDFFQTHEAMKFMNMDVDDEEDDTRMYHLQDQMSRAERIIKRHEQRARKAAAASARPPRYLKKSKSLSRDALMVKAKSQSSHGAGVSGVDAPKLSSTRSLGRLPKVQESALNELAMSPRLKYSIIQKLEEDQLVSIVPKKSRRNQPEPIPETSSPGTSPPSPGFVARSLRSLRSGRKSAIPEDLELTETQNDDDARSTSSNISRLSMRSLNANDMTPSSSRRRLFGTGSAKKDKKNGGNKLGGDNDNDSVARSVQSERPAGRMTLFQRARQSRRRLGSDRSGGEVVSANPFGGISFDLEDSSNHSMKNNGEKEDENNPIRNILNLFNNNDANKNVKDKKNDKAVSKEKNYSSPKKRDDEDENNQAIRNIMGIFKKKKEENLFEFKQSKGVPKFTFANPEMPQSPSAAGAPPSVIANLDFIKKAEQERRQYQSPQQGQGQQPQGATEWRPAVGSKTSVDQSDAPASISASASSPYVPPKHLENASSFKKSSSRRPKAHNLRKRVKSVVVMK